MHESKKCHNYGTGLRMKAFSTAFLCVFLCLPLFTAEAASGPGVVAGWGNNMSGEATGNPFFGSAGMSGYLSGPACSTGLVEIAGQLLTNAVRIAAGEAHGLALRGDGTVVGWGWNLHGQATGLKVEDRHCASGVVTVNGRLLSNIVAIAAGRTHSMALRADGRVVSWGGTDREPGPVPETLTRVVAIAAGAEYSMALTSDGLVTIWGARKTPLGLSNVVAVAAGKDYHSPSIALRSDGGAVQWTAGGAEPLPPEATNLVSVAVGSGHCLALRNDGAVIGWGGNQYGEATGVPTRDFPNTASGLVSLGGIQLKDVAAVAAGHNFSMALMRNGRVVSWGRNSAHQTEVPNTLSNVVAIAAGQSFCLVITTNNTLTQIKK